MQTYIIRRVLLIIPTLFLVTTIIFLSIRLIPGDVIELMVQEIGGRGYQDTQKTLAEMRHTMGLDIPIHIQYGNWLADAFQGDLGKSLWTEEPIANELGARIPVSVELGIFAIITGLMLAIPVGVYSAIRQDTKGDYAGRTIAILAISLPNFWIATMVVVYPSIYWNWSPPLEYIPPGDHLLDNIKQFILPGFIMGLFYAGMIMRMTRTMMLEILRQDYIRTAWAKGLRERTVIFRHAVRNALIPVVTIIGLQAPTLFGGSVVIEQVFTLPGVGRFLIEAINKRDYPVIVAINLLFAVAVLIINLLVDLTYAWLDPRVKYK